MESEEIEIKDHPEKPEFVDIVKNSKDPPIRWSLATDGINPMQRNLKTFT